MNKTALRRILAQEGLLPQRKVASKNLARAFTKYYAAMWSYFSDLGIRKLPDSRKAALNDMRLMLGGLRITVKKPADSTGGVNEWVTLEDGHSLEVVTNFVANLVVVGSMNPRYDQRTTFSQVFKKAQKAPVHLARPARPVKAKAHAVFKRSLQDALPDVLSSKAIAAAKGPLKADLFSDSLQHWDSGVVVDHEGLDMDDSYAIVDVDEPLLDPEAWADSLKVDPSLGVRAEVTLEWEMDPKMYDVSMVLDEETRNDRDPEYQRQVYEDERAEARRNERYDSQESRARITW